ncbi:MAG: hypothetical protein IKC69_02770, partial [Clostridia bacterium]|nr:hypothetical protein [Clostridia bacterium]
VKMSFAELYAGGYLPHTFAEFLGTDPVEDGVADLGLTGDRASVSEIKASTMRANYAISDIFFLITDKDGKVVFNNIQRAKNHFTYTWELQNIFADSIASRFTDGEHTITISCQLSNGEKIVSFKGILTA